MKRDLRLPIVGVSLALIVLATTLLLQTDSRFILSDEFLPHGQCILWDVGLLRVYAVSDLLIGLSYMAISSLLAYLVYKVRHNIPFHWVFLAFGAFIFFCGMTHFMDVLTLWSPIYWTAGGVKALTALASVATALALPPVLPKVMALVESARASATSKQDVIAINRELEAEITTRRQIEEELRAALEREQHLNEFRRQFVIRMSHEFRTPLAVAQSSSDLLISYGDQMADGQKQERLQQIQGEIDHMTHLLDDILTVGRLDSGHVEFKTEWADIVALCRTAVEEIQAKNQKTHVIEYDTVPSCRPALIDTRLVRQAIIHLLENAVDYSPAGSRVRVEVGCDEQEVTIRIEDQGIGVPLEDRDHIFDYFYRGKNAADVSGTGLGLSIAKQAVEMHGGTIRLVSAQSSGSVFILSLPFTTTSF